MIYLHKIPSLLYLNLVFGLHGKIHECEFIEIESNPALDFCCVDRFDTGALYVFCRTVLKVFYYFSDASQTAEKKRMRFSGARISHALPIVGLVNYLTCAILFTASTA